MAPIGNKHHRMPQGKKQEENFDEREYSELDVLLTVTDIVKDDGDLDSTIDIFTFVSPKPQKEARADTWNHGQENGRRTMTLLGHCGRGILSPVTALVITLPAVLEGRTMREETSLATNKGVRSLALTPPRPKRLGRAWNPVAPRASARTMADKDGWEDETVPYDRAVADLQGMKVNVVATDIFTTKAFATRTAMSRWTYAGRRSLALTSP